MTRPFLVQKVAFFETPFISDLDDIDAADILDFEEIGHGRFGTVFK